MDQFRLSILAMAIIDTQSEPRDAHGRRRQLTAEQLDALADFGWHWPDLKGFMTACANAVRPRWGTGANHHADPTALPSVEAASHG